MDDWKDITEKYPPRHKNLLFLSSEGDIYQGRACYGLHAPWWCAHDKLNFGKVFADEGITITHWMLPPPLPGKEKNSGRADTDQS